MFDVITIGTATRDLFVRSKNFRIVRDPHLRKRLGFVTTNVMPLPAGSKLEVEEIYFSTGGGATNAAVTFARQGFKSACFAKVGSDPGGRAAWEELELEKIKPLLVRDRTHYTSYSIILMALGGERTILNFRSASEHVHARDIAWTKLKSRWAYLAPGGIEFPLLIRLVNHFYRRGTIIALNPSKTQLQLGLKKLKPLLSKTGILIVNREEAARLTGTPYKNEKRFFDVLDQAVSGILVVTDGKRGVKVSDGVSRWHAGTFPERKVVDRTGAGDAFGSGFVAGLMQKEENLNRGVAKPMNIAYAIRLGSANATSNIETLGATAGLLTKRGFQAPRWHRLRMTRVS